MRSVKCGHCPPSGGCTVAPDIRLRTLAEVVDHLGAGRQAGMIDGTEVRVRRPAVGRKDPSRRIRVEHGISHLKNWRSLARHHGRRKCITDTIQAVAGPLSHQQASGTRK
ncbi:MULTISPECIES: hypothetical protein [unclassified Streptomyces]|uniref:hypothetical protein n=1 Tax=unclassified Streptomyces TaxID=2593676 RepID=UPI001EFDCC13|nr:hypothetical protein [Streptomyces sp. OspMP-M45]